MRGHRTAVPPVAGPRTWRPRAAVSTVPARQRAGGRSGVDIVGRCGLPGYAGAVIATLAASVLVLVGHADAGRVHVAFTVAGAAAVALAVVMFGLAGVGRVDWKGW